MPAKDMEEVVKKFQRQPEPDMCETAAMKCILDVLAGRHGKTNIRLSPRLEDFGDDSNGEE